MAELKVNGTKDPILFTIDGYRVMVMPMFVQWGDEAEVPTEAEAPTEPVAEVEAPTKDKPKRSRKAKEPVAVEA